MLGELTVNTVNDFFESMQLCSYEPTVYSYNLQLPCSVTSVTHLLSVEEVETTNVCRLVAKLESTTCC